MQHKKNQPPTHNSNIFNKNRTENDKRREEKKIKQQRGESESACTHTKTIENKQNEEIKYGVKTIK